MRLLFSNLFLKLLIGAAVVVGVVTFYFAPGDGGRACSEIENYPNRSAVYECDAGLNTVYLWNHTGEYVDATLTSNVKSEAWLTKTGDAETVKTIRGKLGAPVVIGPGAFMMVANSSGLVYINAPSKILVNIAWRGYVPAH